MTIFNNKVLAVIQARGGSKGITKKNIYPICRYPLIAYTIAAGKKSKYIDDLIVSTDSDDIANVSLEYGASVPFMRPKELAGDTVTSVESLHHACLEAERIFGKKYDYVIEIPCVSPLRDNSDIDGALEKLNNTGADSVIGVVCTGEKHPTRLKKIENDQIYDISTEYPEPTVGSRRQDLKPDSYIRNGSIYAMKRKSLVLDKTRHGNDSRPYIMPIERSINIDELIDIKIAEFFILNGYCNNKPTKIKNIYRKGSGKKKKALITSPTHFIKDVEDNISKIMDCTFVDRADANTIIDLISDVDVLICHPCPEYNIDEGILKHAKNIKIIASTSTGTNHIDKEYCKNNNIDVLSLKESSKIGSIVASSEHTFALMLSVMRKIPFAFDSAKSGRWREGEDFFRGHELQGKTLGIIGYGRIGSNNAKYANSFGISVVAYDPFVKINDSYVKQYESYERVLKESDILMICVHLNDDTYRMVDKKWFDMMKDGVCFINTSRGDVIDEDSLISALISGKVAAAGLDVISDEFSDNKNNHKIIKYSRDNSNLIITPHIAGLTYESERKAFEIIIGEISKRI